MEKRTYQTKGFIEPIELPEGYNFECALEVDLPLTQDFLKRHTIDNNLDLKDKSTNSGVIERQVSSVHCCQFRHKAETRQKSRPHSVL